MPQRWIKEDCLPPLALHYNHSQSLGASGGFNLCCSSCQFKVCFLVAVWAMADGMVAKAIVCIIGKSRSSSRRLFIAFVYPVCCSCFVTVTSHHPPPSTTAGIADRWSNIFYGTSLRGETIVLLSCTYLFTLVTNSWHTMFI